MSMVDVRIYAWRLWRRLKCLWLKHGPETYQDYHPRFPAVCEITTRCARCGAAMAFQIKR